MAKVKEKPLIPEDVIVGRTFIGKRRKTFMGSTNDRTVVWLGISQVQYDSDSVAPGRRLPIVSMDQFLRWARSYI